MPTRRRRPSIGPAVTALWVGCAGALALALIALGALASALGSARFGEVVVLRALGVPARTQSRSRVAELAVTVGTAIVIGCVIGVVTALVTARELAHAAVAGTPTSVVGTARDRRGVRGSSCSPGSCWSPQP